MIAMGAASSSGHGVATTRTATARTGSPETHHAAPASSKVKGTKSSGEPVSRPNEGCRRRLGLLHQSDDLAVRRLCGERRGDHLVPQTPALMIPERISSPA